MKVRQGLSLRDRCPEIYEIPRNQCPETKIHYVSDNNILNLFQTKHTIIIKLAISNKTVVLILIYDEVLDQKIITMIKYQLINTISPLFKGIYFEITSFIAQPDRCHLI